MERSPFSAYISYYAELWHGVWNHISSEYSSWLCTCPYAGRIIYRSDPDVDSRLQNKEALFHPDALYLVIVSIDDLYARIVHFTQTVFGRLSVFQFFNVLFQPFYIQQIAFGTFLNGSIHHLLCRLHLIHLTPKAIGQQCTVRKADSVRSVQESGSFQQLHHFLPPAVRHIQRRRHTPLILYLEVILLYPVFQGMNHFENRVMDLMAAISFPTGCIPHR